MSLQRQFVLLVLLIGAVFLAIFFTEPVRRDTHPAITPDSQVSAGAVAIDTGTSTTAAVTATTTAEKAAITPTPAKEKAPVISAPEAPAATAASDIVSRVENPYPTPPDSFVDINLATRAALVNILCMPRKGGMSPISGSGVVISPRGVILTNAHVAQYVLLAQSGKVDLNCFVRTGAPAAIRFVPRVMHIPSVWVEGHAADILSPHPTGTGEHDYALLYIAKSADSTPLPTAFPFISPDTREAIGFVDDQVVVASYPAEFVGASGSLNLFPASSVTTIQQLLTFTIKSVDVISVGGVIGAQSGSSGGGIVNAWNRLIGIITTTSEGATTSERDLRGITLSYIDRDITEQTGRNLASWLMADPLLQTTHFAEGAGPHLAELLLKQIIK